MEVTFHGLCHDSVVYKNHGCVCTPPEEDVDHDHSAPSGHPQTVVAVVFDVGHGHGETLPSLRTYLSRPP